MRIGIDARFYGPLGKGLGRYTQKLIDNLERIDNTNQYFVFLCRENFNEYHPHNKNFHKVLADFRWYTFSEQLRLPHILKKYKLDLVHFPHFNVPLFYRRKFIVTIHDLILIHFPTSKGTTLNPLFYWLKFLAYKIVICSAIKRAQKIIAVSQFTKKDILKHYRILPEKISVTYEACDLSSDKNPPNEEEILRKYGLPAGRHGIIKPYLLYVGNAYPHKNLEMLVSAFASIKKQKNNLHLVLVGKENYFYKRLKQLVAQQEISDVIFTDQVSDSDLDAVYRNAALYVFASLYEGFGLPPLEAMAQGVPVVSSDHPCMKEVLEESAYYFNAKNKEAMASAILNVLENNNLQKSLIQKGYQQVKKYSWEKMADETLKIYSNVSL